MELHHAVGIITGVVAIVVPATKWGVQLAVRKVESRIDIHEAEDKVIHEHVTEALKRIETKLDRALEKK